MFVRRPVRRNRQGRFQLSLSNDERELLRVLPAQLVELLAEPDDPGLRRLFPPAYHAEGDSQRQAEYRRLMQEDLAERHREALEVLARTAGADELTEEEMAVWMRSLNDIRLVLGTRLDVSEDDDPASGSEPELAVYYFLGYLQECVIEALGGQS